MREVATRSGVPRATLYRYFSSKDHLLSELIFDWGEELLNKLRLAPPVGRTPAERVAQVFARVIEDAESQPRLLGATLRTTLSTDPAARGLQAELGRVIRAYLDAALVDEQRADRRGLTLVMGHVLYSTLAGLATGRTTAQQAIAEVAETARMLLR
jgi:AcrR family transcriptional regulator